MTPLSVIVSAILICTGATTTPDVAELFYNITYGEYAHNHSPSSAPPQLQLLRVPKASSSSLSQIARRAAGCEPPGPCCRYPGDPPGSCPSPHLYQCKLQSRVIGCTNHYIDYAALQNASIVSISMVREPVSRSLSAYFYPGRHHNSNCTADEDLCFRQYLQDRRWSNVVTKMLTGAYAYADVQTCRAAAECPHSLQLARQNLKSLAFVGVSEAWELSLLLLHRRLRHITPSLQEFYLNDRRSTQPSSGTSVHPDHSDHAHRDYLRMHYQQELDEQNQLDAEVYRAVVQYVKQEVVESGLWENAAVREYWHSRIHD